MTGLICEWLGVLWSYLLATQFAAFGKSYLPAGPIVGLWSTLPFFISGIFTVLLEKRRSISLVSCTIAMNIISACVSVIGLFLLLLELLTFGLNASATFWPHESGKLLSQYLFLFVTLELSVTCMVIHWAYKAQKRR